MTSPDHPFIDFELRLEDRDRLQPATWLLLGEAKSKNQHLIGAPLKPDSASALFNVYLAKGAHATTAIEGNTLSEDDVLNLVNGQLQLPESQEYMAHEVENIIKAVGSIDRAITRGERLPITVARIKELHGMVFDGMHDPPDVLPGQLRRHDVVVGSVYKPPHWTHVEPLLERLVTWLTELEPDDGLATMDRFVADVLRAILAHLYIAWIHPFGDGNGRTARLLEVQILASSGTVPIIATNLLSDHYNRTRTLYAAKLAAASREGDVAGFIAYAVQGFVEGLTMQVEEVKRSYREIAWESFVHEVIGRHRSTEARSRQRRLALALPEDRWVDKDAATLLTTRLARDYARGGERMPARDLNFLVTLGLADKKGRSYRARKSVVDAFASPVAQFNGAVEI